MTRRACKPDLDLADASGALLQALDEALWSNGRYKLRPGGTGEGIAFRFSGAWTPTLARVRRAIAEEEDRLNIPRGWSSRRRSAPSIRRLLLREERVIRRFTLAVMRQLGVAPPAGSDQRWA